MAEKENMSDSEFWYISSISDEKHIGILSKMKSTNFRQHDGDNLKIQEIVDLASCDFQCYVCNQVLTKVFHPLADVVTSISKTKISQKIGELLGKSYVVVVAEDDYVCQNCMKLFNKLDNLEVDLAKTKNFITKNIKDTYMNVRKKKKIPTHLYKELQSNLKRKNEYENQGSFKRTKGEVANVFTEKQIHQFLKKGPVKNIREFNDQFHIEKRSTFGDESSSNVQKTIYAISKNYEILEIQATDIDFHKEYIDKSLIIKSLQDF